MAAITLLNNPKLLLDATATTPTGVHNLQTANLGTVTIHIHSHSPAADCARPLGGSHRMATMIQRAAEFQTEMTWNRLAALLAPLKAVKYQNDDKAMVHASRIRPEAAEIFKKARYFKAQGNPRRRLIPKN